MDFRLLEKEREELWEEYRVIKETIRSITPYPCPSCKSNMMNRIKYRARLQSELEVILESIHEINKMLIEMELHEEE